MLNLTGASENPFNVSDFKQDRGKKAVAFEGSLYYSNELEFNLQENRSEYQELERGKVRRTCPDGQAILCLC